MRRAFIFALTVLTNFQRNQGLLLASAVAYNALLSLIPSFAVVLVILSRFFDEAELLRWVGAQIRLVASEQTDVLLAQISAFLAHREVFGGIGGIVLLFFSSLAVRMLNSAFHVIFGREPPQDGHWRWLSWLVPYLVVPVLAFGLWLTSIIGAGITALGDQHWMFLGYDITSFAPTQVFALFGFIAQVFVFAGLYISMPASRVSVRPALMGGFCAAVLWEITRHILVWYFSKVSLVNVIYGSLATGIIVLLTMEAAAVIVLLGAQVIAEWTRVRGELPSDASATWSGRIRSAGADARPT